MNLKDFLVNSARLFPDKTAVIFREKRLTYGELYRDTCICGSALRNMGVKKGDSIFIPAGSGDFAVTGTLQTLCTRV